MTFKIGDKIMCINDKDSGIPKGLHNGKIYTVNAIGSGMSRHDIDHRGVKFVALKELFDASPGWMVSRFKLTKETSWRKRICN